MTLQQIRDEEIGNRSRIILHRFSNEWRAYGHSAWMLTEKLSLECFVHREGETSSHAVYLSFCEEELETILRDYPSAIRTDDKIVAEAGFPFDIHAYYKWKQLETGPQTKNIVKPRQEMMTRLWDKLSDWSVEGHSPVQNLDFLEEIKKMTEEI